MKNVSATYIIFEGQFRGASMTRGTARLPDIRRRTTSLWTQHRRTKIQTRFEFRREHNPGAVGPGSSERARTMDANAGNEGSSDSATKLPPDLSVTGQGLEVLGQAVVSTAAPRIAPESPTVSTPASSAGEASPSISLMGCPPPDITPRIAPTEASAAPQTNGVTQTADLNEVPDNHGSVVTSASTPTSTPMMNVANEDAKLIEEAVPVQGTSTSAPEVAVTASIPAPPATAVPHAVTALASTPPEKAGPAISAETVAKSLPLAASPVMTLSGAVECPTTFLEAPAASAGSSIALPAAAVTPSEATTAPATIMPWASNGAGDATANAVSSVTESTGTAEIWVGNTAPEEPLHPVRPSTTANGAGDESATSASAGATENTGAAAIDVGGGGEDPEPRPTAATESTALSDGPSVDIPGEFGNNQASPLVPPRAATAAAATTALVGAGVSGGGGSGGGVAVADGSAVSAPPTAAAASAALSETSKDRGFPDDETGGVDGNGVPLPQHLPSSPVTPSDGTTPQPAVLPPADGSGGGVVPVAAAGLPSLCNGAVPAFGGDEQRLDEPAVTAVDARQQEEEGSGSDENTDYGEEEEEEEGGDKRGRVKDPDEGPAVDVGEDVSDKQSTDTPTEEDVGESAQVPPEVPSEAPPEATPEGSPEEPAGGQAEEPAEGQAEVPAGAKAEETAEEPVEKAVEEPARGEEEQQLLIPRPRRRGAGKRKASDKTRAAPGEEAEGGVGGERNKRRGTSSGASSSATAALPPSPPPRSQPPQTAPPPPPPAQSTKRKRQSPKKQLQQRQAAAAATAATVTAKTTPQKRPQSQKKLKLTPPNFEIEKHGGGKIRKRYSLDFKVSAARLLSRGEGTGGWRLCVFSKAAKT